jgi:hypothetical protein
MDLDLFVCHKLAGEKVKSENVAYFSNKTAIK